MTRSLGSKQRQEKRKAGKRTDGRRDGRGGLGVYTTRLRRLLLRRGGEKKKGAGCRRPRKTAEGGVPACATRTVGVARPEPFAPPSLLCSAKST